MLQRFRSENVHQDHVFISRGSATIQDFVRAGTPNGQPEAGVQIVGGKNVTVHRGSIANERAFRDGAKDRNDHGVMINYTPGEGRVPENIALEDVDIHDMTSTGVAVAGVQGLALRRVNAPDNGPGGRANDLVPDPAPQRHHRAQSTRATRSPRSPRRLRRAAPGDRPPAPPRRRN